MLIGLAAATAQIATMQPDMGQLNFEVVKAEAAGLRSVPFADSENRYKLVVFVAGEPVDLSLPLGEPEVFSPFQSSQVLALPPGAYAVFDEGRRSRDIDLPGVEAAALARIQLRANDWVELRCSAQGPPSCTAEHVRGFSEFR